MNAEIDSQLQPHVERYLAACNQKGLVSVVVLLDDNNRFLEILGSNVTRETAPATLLALSNAATELRGSAI